MVRIKKINLLLICFIVVFFVFDTVRIAANRQGTLEIGQSDYETIKVGLLFSTTGTSAEVEKSMINAAEMAFDEINDNGGIHGKQIEYILENYSSTPSLAEDKIRKLIAEDHVVATIGCYSSSSRQATFSALEQYNSLLIYPTYTEGAEQNEHVIYTGALHSQQATEFICWMMQSKGQRVYLLGNDYTFPVLCNKQAKTIIARNHGTVVGETYVKTGEINFDAVIRDILEKEPDFIYCDLIGDSLSAFYDAYAKSDLSPDTCPIASITSDEMTIKDIGSESAEGHYAAMPYFSEIDSEVNRDFVKRYEQYVHDDSIMTCLAETTYNSCILLAKALEEVDDQYDTDALIDAITGMELETPQGSIRIDENHYTWMNSRFAVVQDGRLKIIYESESAIEPVISEASESVD